MCYRDNVPPLSFEGIHTACISGDNGNGKSTLIDAMTWALWGKARAKSNDDLVHLGETEMGVEFDFAVGDETYRIIRRHSKPKRRSSQGKTILEFQIATDGRFRTLTGNSITQTQQKITDTLHIDYTTFVNSALLLQGRADEFTVKRPVERKQVLSDILRLSFYDKLEEQAKDRAKEREVEKAQLENTSREIEQELSQKPAYEAEFNAWQSQLATIENEVAESETRVKKLRQEKEALENKQAELARLDEHLARIQKDLERWDDLAKQHRLRLKEYQSLIAQRSTIEEEYASFTEAKALNNELDQKFRMVTTLHGRKHQLEMAISQAGQAIIKEHAIVQSQISELETSAQRLPLIKKELQQVKLRLRELAESEERLSQQKQSIQELRRQANYLDSNKTQLEREIKELEEKLDLLLTQKESRCPLCETELAANGLKLIETKYTAERHTKFESLRINQIELVQKQAELARQESGTAHLETKINQDKPALRTKANVLSQEITEAKQNTERLREARKSLTEIEEQLAKRDFAPTEQKTLKELEGELAKLGYDSGRHDRVRKRLTSLEHYEGLMRKLEEAERLVGQEKESAVRAKEAAQEIRLSLEVEGQKRMSLDKELDRIPQLLNNYTQAENEYQALVARQKQKQEALWSVKAKLERLKELEEKRREKGKQLSQVVKEEKVYIDLAQAFGKRGIQALLIEGALPEIEAEANELLSRMTDNRMQIKIETQRETKAGNVVETLDIRVSDEIGTRNYEMFSGGEAFRINFAIRIALSKLLARRAAARLPTLVIDEGFGTQDSIGIEKLKEAINSIQNDFDKILVITHIEELRDAFSTRINVLKTANGSTLEVG